MNLNFPKINKIEIIGLNLNERKKIESIINDANFKNIFHIDKQYLKKKIDSINMVPITELGVAPKAFLIPNSLVLSLTTKTIIFEIPITPAINVPIPTNVIIY